MNKNDLIKFTVEKLPQKPGIYFFKDNREKVIYIGKANSLKERVKSYFQTTSDSKVLNILNETSKIDYILTDSEREAAFLENNFIQQYQPKFNLRLKDDKSFPYLKLTIAEKYPGIYLTRKAAQDKSKYFGPFSPAHQARKTIHILNKYFGIRSCREKIPAIRKRPCLDYDIDLCSAPCVGYITETSYRERVENAQMFLEGNVKKLNQFLEEKMHKASECQEFEDAKYYRDLILTLEQIKDRPKLISIKSENKDILGYARINDRVGIYVFRMRKGKVIESEHHILPLQSGKDNKKVITEFLRDYYCSPQEIPKKILLPFKPDTLPHLKEIIENRKNGKVYLSFPKKGKNQRLIKFANRNAALLFEKKMEKDQPLSELKQALGLKNLPYRIEGFDISNTGGQDSVGSMSVFVNAKPLKSDYRKYKIKSISRPDDVGSIQEVILRRYTRVSKNIDHKPDLILVDGGKGQLNAAEKALKELNLVKLPLLALAKKEELIYCQKYPHGLRLDKTSSGLRLLQHIRDEAHRFALDFHRKQREKKSTASELDNIPGIGPKRKAALLSHYERIDDIKKAPLKELKKLIGARAAQALLQDYSKS